VVRFTHPTKAGSVRNARNANLPIGFFLVLLLTANREIGVPEIVEHELLLQRVWNRVLVAKAFGDSTMLPLPQQGSKQAAIEPRAALPENQTARLPAKRENPQPATPDR
jgi:hypothetical protein